MRDALPGTVVPLVSALGANASQKNNSGEERWQKMFKADTIITPKGKRSFHFTKKEVKGCLGGSVG